MSRRTGISSALRDIFVVVTCTYPFGNGSCLRAPEMVYYRQTKKKMDANEK
ncbi:hypothetical protein BRYFOR_08454 [Marvinbryantia formatexigens DSM 14469]|uniref:Uncharacterized protein n=1 Tax=Marvinbryantia formatexigens DSM 14469 TaxID=478749 RepID=C6LIL4_9FIRM|nr:hypothetical protein BRYFOR_08454 [Marvinbryantia formatexigens DSM 14469]